MTGDREMSSSSQRQAGYALFVPLLILFSIVANAQSSDRFTIVTDEQTQQLLADAESLLAAGDAERAFARLSPKEAQLAGHPYFDYLLGVAALDSRRYSEAIFALRRSLAVRGEFSGARMELARAYFESGSRETARPIFVQLLNENPPTAVRRVIEQYIDAVDARSIAPRARYSFIGEMQAGFDSNANASTPANDFLGFMLNPNNVEQDSAFAELAVGFNGYVPLSQRTAWTLNARLAHRANPDAGFVDSTMLNGLAALNWQRGRWYGRAGIDGWWGARDGSSNESYFGLDAMGGRRLSDRWDFTVGLRAGALRFTDSIDVLDVNRRTLTAGLAYRFDNGARFSTTGIFGNDDERQAGSPYGNDRTGVNLSLYVPVSSRTVLQASLGSIETEYDGLFFGSSRSDDQISALLQLEFRDVMRKGLSVIPRVRYTDNDSDIGLYRYDRTEVALTFRYARQ